MYFNKMHPKVGARPGTLVISKDAPPPKISVIEYTLEQVESFEIQDIQQLTRFRDTDKVAWIDVQGFGDEQVIRDIGEMFSLHPLAMEDIVNIPQRPKVESYDDQLLIVTRMVRPTGPGEVEIEQVSLILGRNYVLTFQQMYGDILDVVRKRIRARKGNLRRNQADFLTYAIVDAIVDGYYPVLESFGEFLEELEDTVIQNPGPGVLKRLNRTKNVLINLRRAIWPQREAVHVLIRDDHELVSENVRLFLRDTYDHCLQTAEVAEMYRDMVAGLMNTYLSAVANRTNDVMKALTITATIFIPLTFVAGIYGMNFEYMPELHVKWAYPLVWITMIGVVVGMLLFFKHKGWIWNREAE